MKALGSAKVHRSGYDFQLLTDGDTFGIGNIQFQVMHTPGHTPESISLPDQLDEIPSDKPLITQCGSGARSATAASILKNAGFDVINMSGGYREWAAADLPRVKEPEQAASTANA